MAFFRHLITDIMILVASWIVIYGCAAATEQVFSAGSQAYYYDLGGEFAGNSMQRAAGLRANEMAQK